ALPIYIFIDINISNLEPLDSIINGPKLMLLSLFYYYYYYYYYYYLLKITKLGCSKVTLHFYTLVLSSYFVI
ncbi:MAG: hypothetical protein K7J15_04060, partial [Candidatus Regiella insecticola]|nr:hypothetical protein [Candidatus Regiella insecticola]MCX2959511.1 hypothetical protein [Serratia symbiotica]